MVQVTGGAQTNMKYATYKASESKIKINVLLCIKMMSPKNTYSTYGNITLATIPPYPIINNRQAVLSSG